MKYFSMFTGVGGFELGIGDRGECIGFSEWDKYSNQVLSYRFPNIKNWGDCTKINPNELPDFDMLCGGFPCQAFSIAGKREGLEDTRGTMFYQIAKITKAKRPKYLFLENVKGLLNHQIWETKTFTIIGDIFEELGYEIQWVVLNSKFFGVPQNRERVFIIGSLRGERRPQILPFRQTGQETNEQGYLKRLDKKPENKRDSEANRIYIDDGISPCLTEKIKYWNFLISSSSPREIEWKEECPTLQARDYKGPKVVKFNEIIRRLTPTECCRLQGFPDDWNKYGLENGKKVEISDTQRYKQMGNAVTINVIRAISNKLFTQ